MGFNSGFKGLISIALPLVLHILWSGIAQSVQRIAADLTVRGTNSGGDEIFRTRPDLEFYTMGTGSHSRE